VNWSEVLPAKVDGVNEDADRGRGHATSIDLLT